MYLLRRLSTLSPRRNISRFLSSQCGGKFGESGGEGESGECESPESDGDNIWLPSTYVTQFRGDVTSRNAHIFSVSGITSAYCCEKQKEYELFVGLKRDTDGMKAGREIHYRYSQIRHYHQYQAIDKDWINPLMKAVQTLATLTESQQGRELMIIGTIEGQWVKGIIDFVNFGNEKGVNEMGEIKTRQSFSMPSEAQQSKDIFQISLYKVIFDFLVNQEVPFPVDYFFAHFSLKRTQLLPQNIIDELEGLGHVAVTIEDLVLIYKAMFRPMDKVSFNLIVKYKLQVPTPDEPIFIGIRYPIFDLEGTLRKYKSVMEMWNCERPALPRKTSSSFLKFKL